MRRLMLLTVLALPLLLSGCASPAAEPALPTGVRDADVAIFDLRMDDSQATITITMQPPAPFSFPDGTKADVLPVRIHLEDSEGRSFERLAYLEAKDGRLMAIGDLALQPAGSDQYFASTTRWAGHPVGTFDPYRCIAGLALPATVAASAGKSHAELGPLATWNASDGSVKLSDGRNGGLLALDPGASGGWPVTARWETPDDRTCELHLREVRPGGMSIPWGSGDGRSKRELAKSALDGRVPPAESLPVSFSLKEAAMAAEREPRLRSFLESHRQAWVVHAEYVGPVGTAGLAEPAKWMLLYGDAASGDVLLVTAERHGAGPAVAVAHGEVPWDFVAPRRSVSDGMMEAGALLSHLDLGRLSGGRTVAISWFGAESDSDIGTSDAAVWQVTWPFEGGCEVQAYTAVDGWALSRVRAVCHHESVGR